MYQIAETSTLQKSIKKKKLQDIYKKLKKDAFPLISKDPYYGPNIKKLSGNLEGLHRYRIGNYRLIYLIDEEHKMIFLADLVHRKDAY